MIHICYFSNQFFSFSGHGIARYAHHLYNALLQNKAALKLHPVSASTNSTKKELNAFINTARTNFERATIITAPYYSLDLNCADKREDFKKLLLKNYLEYIDYTEVFLGKKEYFFDNRHLNLEEQKYLIDVIK